MLQAEKSRVRDPKKLINFSFHLILLAALGPEFYSACNRNEYKKYKNNVSVESSAVGAQG
jgi:hypothetical protein